MARAKQRRQPVEPHRDAIEHAKALLSEHFEAVQIFASRDEGGGTMHVETGSGNFYARYGQIREWLDGAEERTRVEVRAEMEDED